MGVVYYANYFVWFEVARADLLRSLGWTYREMEHAGVSLPVIEAHCDYHRPARYDEEMEVRTKGRMLSPVRMEFTYEVVRRDDQIGRGLRPHGSRRAGPRRKAVPSPGSHQAALRMKALVTGAAGFIGSHLTGTLLDRGAHVTGLDCFTDYYARSIKEANLAHNQGRAGFQFVEARHPGRRSCRRLLDGVTHVFHLAAQAGVRKSWGRDFRTYTDNNVDASQRLLEACVGIAACTASSTRRARRSTATTPRSRCARDALPQPVSPYGVTKLAAEQLCYLYHANHGVPATSLRYFTVYGPRQRPDMGFHRFIRAAIKGDPITLYGDGEQTRDFTFVKDAVAATAAAGDQGVPGRAYNIGGGSRVSINQVLDMIGRIAGRPLDVRREPAQKGDMRDTFADTGAGEGGSRLSHPPCRSKKGSKRSIDGFRQHPRSCEMGAFARLDPRPGVRCRRARPDPRSRRSARWSPTSSSGSEAPMNSTRSTG